ncbi:hypothetical protein [Desulfovibrio sp.]|uniref:hypothetical protein n=1 Tax=Desulfovibrio sp. TaxID=885 RepID=UPI001C3BF874|nr:hypothetical protein [Desulfovibrio sp.]MCI7568380.1 hypothetical protein [Desulfovibrio sp.]MDM8215188.1 hypothetical protein [Desulfovibrio piger]HIX41089.1 hypothetical protein [Candidatus Desulfovibrio intestinigallinarum]
MSAFESFMSWLVRLISPAQTGNLEQGDTDDDIVWDQNARTVLAILIVIVSAFIIYWIMS